MTEYIHSLKKKPEHVRRRIAVGTSVGVTALVGVIWFGTLATTGAFNLSPKTDATADAGTTKDTFALSDTNNPSNFSQLLGAVGAATGASSSKPALTIVDGATSSSFDASRSSAPQPSATVIPF